MLWGASPWPTTLPSTVLRLYEVNYYVLWMFNADELGLGNTVTASEVASASNPIIVNEMQAEVSM